MQHVDTLPALVLDRYRLVRKLGAGGFGTVWLAHDERLDREVAVKRVPTADASSAERARREALVAAKLGHPGIVALYEAGADDAACYLVSELVRGETLADLEAEGALSDRDVVEIGVTLCEALAHAHARGVVHRDVKPGNVMIPEARQEGEAAAKLTDFGIARVVGDDALTRTGDVLGTLAYMAPEHAEGRGATKASDLYALGLVLYEAFSGVNPVRGSSPAETARRLGMRLPSLARQRRDLPRGLCAAVDAAVSPEPRERGTPAALRRALSGARGDVDDEPGVIAEAGLATATRRWWTGRPEAIEDRTRHGWAFERERDDDTWAGFAERLEDDEPAAPRRLAIPARLAAGAAAGALAAAAVAGLASGPPPEAPAVVGAAVGVAVTLLPRLAWLAAAYALLAWLAAEGRPGTAVVLAPALVAVPLLARRAKAAWSLPAAAPVLGLAGLAVAYPALAGQARTAWRRGALGALGALWLALGVVLLDRRLLAGPPDGLPGAWEEDGAQALNVLGAVFDPRLAGVAAAFAVAAVILPWLVRGRSVAPDAVAATAWAAGLAAGVQLALAPDDPRGLVGGAVVAGVLALLLRAARGPAS